MTIIPFLCLRAYKMFTYASLFSCAKFVHCSRVEGRGGGGKAQWVGMRILKAKVYDATIPHSVRICFP